ncbi:MAG: hypothetical protein IJ273_02090, partial [Alphaproteobacteria bacterium]|nr:hypothetical protein [Alphaproteobacteria bacterium]
AFPSTYTDLSFEERIENAAAGYQPYAGKSAYRTMKIESAEDAAIRAQRAQQNRNTYCAQNKQQYQTMAADLATLKNCRTRGTKFADCKLKGTY